MKNIFLALIGFTFLNAAAWGQAIVPTSYDFETTPGVPTGWTTNTTSSYGTGVSGIAGKLNGDDQHFTVFLADEIGPVTYYLKGWVGGSVTSWVGVFSVEESADGVNWTTMRTFVDNLDESNYVQYTDQPMSSSRYIRWYYTDKQSGANVGIDDVVISTPVATPAQEINCVFGGTNAPSGSQIAFNAPVGNTVNVSITVENLGTQNTLTVSNTSISGPAMNDFVLTTGPLSILAGSSDMINFNFTPSATGTRLATLTIANNDANEDPYILELYGVGGDYATEPTSAPAGLVFTDVKSYRLTGSYANSGADGYLVVYKRGSAIVGAPADGTPYMPGDAVGDGKVVYSGPSTSFIPNNIVASTDFYFDIYSYNGFGQYVNYLESTPLQGNVTSGGPNIGGYYNGLDPNSATFPEQLGNNIVHSQWVWYGEFDENYINDFASRDTTGGDKVITGAYGGEHFVYTAPFNWDIYSREHTYPHSWMPTNPADDPEQLEYNDMHHLFPTHFSNANQVRLNYPLGEVVNVASTYGGAKFGTDANGNNVYEPRDEHKGDAARAIFYVCTRYHPENIFEDWSLPENIGIFVPYGQDEAILKQWHWDDLPDAWEIARNDYIDSVQGNRNPFVDSVDWVCYINFSDMSHNPSGNCAVGIEEAGALADLEMFPNPNNGQFTVALTLNASERVQLNVLSVTGQTVYQSAFTAQSGENQQALKLDLPAGVYEVEVRGESFTTFRKIVIE